MSCNFSLLVSPDWLGFISKDIFQIVSLYVDPFRKERAHLLKGLHENLLIQSD